MRAHGGLWCLGLCSLRGRVLTWAPCPPGPYQPKPASQTPQQLTRHWCLMGLQCRSPYRARELSPLCGGTAEAWGNLPVWAQVSRRQAWDLEGGVGTVLSSPLHPPSLPLALSQFPDRVWQHPPLSSLACSRFSTPHSPLLGFLLFRSPALSFLCFILSPISFLFSLPSTVSPICPPSHPCFHRFSFSPPLPHPPQPLSCHPTHTGLVGAGSLLRTGKDSFTKAQWALAG